MLLDSLLRYLVSRGARTRSQRRRRRAAHKCSAGKTLFLEHLEERALPSFLGTRAFDAGNLPISVAVADVNSDSRPDLAVANYDSNNVSVLLGVGDGTFQVARSFSVGSGPRSVAMGDVDNDGRLDLAVANEGPYPTSSSVSVLLGNGDGTFQGARHFTAGINPWSVVMGDVNGDDRADLALANNLSNTVSVLLGNGDGSFQGARTLRVGSAPRSVAVADFNGDSRLDVATANSLSHTVSVLLGNGDGSFQAARDFSAATYPNTVAVGEFNGDGHLDLAVNNNISPAGTVTVLLGNGDGTFGAARSFLAGSYPFSLAVGDFDGDSHRDLVVANGLSGTVSVLLGNGDGSFQAARIFFAGNPSVNALSVADVNGDGRVDLAVVNRLAVSVLLGNGDRSFQVTRSFSAGNGPRSVAVGEFNGDGFLDLATANPLSHTVSVLLGNGDGSFQAARSFSAGNGPRFVAVGEFNGDGLPDLAVANNAFNGTVGVLLGNGDGSFQASVNYPAGGGSNSVAVADINGDGRQDLVTTNFHEECDKKCRIIESGVRVMLGNGDGTFGGAGAFPAGLDPRSVAVGDVNGDGHRDLAVANRASQYVSVLLGYGDGTFQPARHFEAGNNANSVAVGEFNGDGALDLAVANEGTNPYYRDSNVTVHLGNGDGTFQAARYLTAGFGPQAVTVADTNGDGRGDLVVVFFGGVRVLLGNGDGSFQTTHVSYVAGATPNSVAVANFDSDSWPDLAVANSASNDVSILLNAADDAAFFYLDAPAAVPAGQPFDLTVYALSGDWQRLAHGYRGTVAFWSSDEAATLPEPYRFRPEDYGIVSFSRGVTLRTPGLQELYAFDLETFTVIGYAAVEVLGRGPGPGGGGMRSGGADFALAQAGLDLATWTRPRKVVPIAGGTSAPSGG